MRCLSRALLNISNSVSIVNYTAHRRKASNGHLVLHTSNGAQSLTTAPIKGAELSRAVNECKNNWPPYMLAVEIGQRVSQSEKPVRSQ